MIVNPELRFALRALIATFALCLVLAVFDGNDEESHHLFCYYGEGYYWRGAIAKFGEVYLRCEPPENNPAGRLTWVEMR